VCACIQAVCRLPDCAHAQMARYAGIVAGLQLRTSSLPAGDLKVLRDLQAWRAASTLLLMYEPPVTAGTYRHSLCRTPYAVGGLDLVRACVSSSIAAVVFEVVSGSVCLSASDVQSRRRGWDDSALH
jgi:hypothetical protein